MTEMQLHKDQNYQSWLTELKQAFAQRRMQAVIKVNQELLGFYWQLGGQMIAKQQHSKWGEGFITQLSQDLSKAFPEVKGFSQRNLKYIRQWVQFWQTDQAIGQQLVAQLTALPWGHNIILISKCHNQQEAQFYLAHAHAHGWSRSILSHQMESQLWQRQGKAVSNFAQTLPPVQSDLAEQSLKDPYVFDFLSLTDTVQERELEHALVKHITDFLLELGAGFAYVGKQVQLSVGGQDYYLDLLFYHLKLRCYVVIELKATDFTPEHAGKLSFYLTAVDRQIKTEQDNPTIGLLLCKTKNKVVAEYALSDINKPIGVSEYQLTHALPDNLKSSLPSIEDIEQELAKELGNNGEEEL